LFWAVVNTTLQRFPRRARIRTSADYQAVFSEGIRVSGSYFRCHLAMKPSEASLATAERPRLGIAVSKRVDKTAVGRNKIKRICREWFRLHQDRLLPVRYVVVAKPEANQISAPRLRADLEKLFRRAHTLLMDAGIGTMHDLLSADIPTPQNIVGRKA
jgi:ribonuclease P protein component